MEKIKVFACPTAEEFTKEICDYLEIEPGKINSMKFKNDNNFVQLLETVRATDVYIVQTCQPPINERIMELLITILFSYDEKLKCSNSKGFLLATI